MFVWISLCSRMGALEKPKKVCVVLECLGTRCTPVKKKGEFFTNCAEMRERLYAHRCWQL